MSGITHQEIGFVRWGSFASCSADFIGASLRSAEFRNEVTMQHRIQVRTAKLCHFSSVFIRVHPWLNFLFSEVSDFENGTVSQNTIFNRLVLGRTHISIQLFTLQWVCRIEGP
jgi:hypothetical protein